MSRRKSPKACFVNSPCSSPRLLGAGNRLVREIDDVGGVLDLVALELQVPDDHVRDDEAPVAAEMRHEVDRGAAGLHADRLGADGLEELLLLGSDVVKPKRRLLLVGKKLRREVALGAVGKDDDDESFLELLRLLDSHVHGRPGAHAGEDPLLAQKPPGHLVGVLVEDVHLLVEAALVEDPRPVGLFHVLEALDLVPHVGLDADDPDVPGCIP